MNLSKNLLIIGTKKIIQQNTTGQAIKNLSNQLAIEFSFIPDLKITINADTKVLVQKDIITAKVIKRFFLILFA